MKKIIVFFSVLILSNVMLAQIQFGVNGGLQYSNLTNLISYGITTNGKITPTLGLTMRYLSKKSLSFNSGLQYHQIAFNKTNLEAANEDGTNLGIVKQHAINYLQIPLSAAYKFDIGNHGLFFVGLGVNLNATLNDKITLTQAVPVTISNPYIIDSKGVASTFWSTSFLFGYQIKNIGFQFDIQNSITYIYKKPTVAPEWKAFVGRCTLVYLLKQNKKS